MDIHSLPRILTAKFKVDTGCWLWTAARDLNGYGVINRKIDGIWRTRKAHRVIYALLVKPIPSGMVLDHLCRTPACVNPSHLEPVSQKINVQRGTVSNVVRARYKKHVLCPKGHPLFGENLYAHVRMDGHINKQCRICRRDTKRARRASGARG